VDCGFQGKDKDKDRAAPAGGTRVKTRVKESDLRQVFGLDSRLHLPGLHRIAGP
jgi:hypothetical protein